jgi:hypothetical protein
MDLLTPDQRARVDAMLAWNRRKDDLGTVLTDEEWARLRLDLRTECANHAKTDELYGRAEDCEHDVPTDDPDYEDDQHGWSYDAEVMLCLARVVDHACLCQDGYCSQLSSAEEARDELWVNVSYGHRRAQRAAHLAPQIADVFFDHETDIAYERLEEIAAGCRTEAQFAAAVKQEEADDA